MIWNHKADKLGADLAALIAAELSAAVPAAADSAPAIAQAVADFIAQQHRAEALPSAYLLLLIARALWAIGEEAIARQFIAARGREWHVSPPFAEAIVSRDLSLSHWRFMLGSRLVRPDSSGTWGAIWIVDLRRLSAPATRLELTLLRAVNALMDHLAGVWDKAQGEGILGLQHLRAAAADLLGCSPRLSPSLALAAEIKSQCCCRLQAAGRARGWQTIPEVIQLDL